MIAAISMAFIAYASPLANATNYIWTTPNMPSNIAGVVAGPFARTEDIAYIHEAIAERRVLGGIPTDASTTPIPVIRTPDRPLTPAQAQENGWTVISTGIVDGVVNVLSYMTNVTNWPTAGGVDTWRMQPVTFSLPGGTWIHPSNDVSNLTTAMGDSFTNCFSPWLGYMQPTNMTLRGLAWRPVLTNVLKRLNSYTLNARTGNSTNNVAIGSVASSDYNIGYDYENHSMYLVPDNDTHVYTNGTDMGFSAYRTAAKISKSYEDEDGNLQPYSGSPLTYVSSRLSATIGSVPSGQDILVSTPLPFCFSTGGVWRIKSANAIANVFYYYNHERFITGTGYETVTNVGGNVFIPVQTTSTMENENGNLIVHIATPLHTIASSAAQFAGVPTSESGFIPPEPQGQMMADDSLYNYDDEELILRVNGFYIILTVEPLTTIQELQ